MRSVQTARASRSSRISPIESSSRTPTTILHAASRSTWPSVPLGRGWAAADELPVAPPRSGSVCAQHRSARRGLPRWTSRSSTTSKS